jgi:hypothetical protein
MRCPPEKRRPTICGRKRGWLLPAAGVDIFGMPEGSYGGLVEERRKKISCANGIVGNGC